MRWPTLAVIAVFVAKSAFAQTPDCSALPSAVFLGSTTDMKPFYARAAGRLASASGYFEER